MPAYPPPQHRTETKAQGKGQGRASKPFGGPALLAVCFIITALCIVSLIWTRGIDTGTGVCPTDVSVVVVQPKTFASMLRDDPSSTTIPVTTTTTAADPPPVTLNTVNVSQSTTTSTRPTTTTRPSTARKGP